MRPGARNYSMRLNLPDPVIRVLAAADAETDLRTAIAVILGSVAHVAATLPPQAWAQARAGILDGIDALRDIVESDDPTEEIRALLTTCDYANRRRNGH